VTLDRREQEMVAAAAQAGRAAAQETVPVLRNAIVMDVDPLNARAMVAVDGPGNTDAVPADVLAPFTFRPGDRVQIMFTYPRGAVVLGRKRGDDDDWHRFGDDDSGSPFLNGWGHRLAAPAAVEEGQDGPGYAAFRRRSGTVELAGWIQKLTGAANNAIQLRPDLLPRNEVYFPALNGFLESSAIRIGATGLLSSALGDTLLCLDGISYTVRPSDVADPL
jgi:hypothetical protein